MNWWAQFTLVYKLCCLGIFILSETRRQYVKVRVGTRSLQKHDFSLSVSFLLIQGSSLVFNIIRAA